jgi:hypothetical protein
MADASRLATGQSFLDGSFVPGGIATPEGFDGGGQPTFGGCPLARLPFVGKFSMMQARRVSLAAARAASRCESDLSMESCLVALSTTRGGVCPGESPNRGPVWSASGGR